MPRELHLYKLSDTMLRQKEPNRTTAFLNNEVRYVTAYPCSKGHTLRYTSSGICVDCAQARNEKKKAALKQKASPDPVRKQEWWGPAHE